MDEATVAVGEILRAHGVRGGVWVKPLGATPSRGQELREVVLVNGSERTRATIASVRVADGRWIVTFKGVSTRDAAERLRGATIEIARRDSPALPEGTFYVHELVGREVWADDGRLLGLLTDVLSTGSNDVYIIDTPDGELLFPALKELVVECPRGGRAMTVRVPAGLLEACLVREA